MQSKNRAEWSGGGFYTKQALKSKSKEVYALVLYSHSNKSNKTHPGGD